MVIAAKSHVFIMLLPHFSKTASSVPKMHGQPAVRISVRKVRFGRFLAESKWKERISRQ